MRNFISTSLIGVKRKFEVYNINEFRTSCLHHKTESKCENLYLEDKTNKLRKLHSVRYIDISQHYPKNNLKFIF